MKKGDKIHILDKHYTDFHSYLYVLIVIGIFGLPLILIFHFFVHVWGHPIELTLVVLFISSLFLGYLIYKIENHLKEKK